MIKNLDIRWKLLSRSRLILVARRALNRIGLKYIHGIVYVRPLNIEIQEAVTVIPIDVKLASIEDIHNKKYPGVKLASGDDPVSHQEALDRLKSGDICFIALMDDVIVGFSWLYFQREKYERAYEHNLKFSEDEALIYDRLVFREFRRAGVSNKLNEEQLRFLKANCYKKAVVLIRYDNIPSIKSFEKYGFYPKKSIICLKIVVYKSICERFIC